MTKVSIYPYVPPKRPDPRKANAATERARRERERQLDIAMLHGPSADSDEPEEEKDGPCGLRLSAGLRYRHMADRFKRGKARKSGWP